MQAFVTSFDICEKRKKSKQKEASVYANLLKWSKIQKLEINIAGPFTKTNNGFVFI